MAVKFNTALVVTHIPKFPDWTPKIGEFVTVESVCERLKIEERVVADALCRNGFFVRDGYCFALK